MQLNKALVSVAQRQFRPLANIPRVRKSLRMRTIYIDCEGVESVGEVWQRYLDAAKPAGAADFGRNLDAFWDAVEHGGPGCPGRVKLVFSDSSGLAALRVGSGLFILEVLRRLASEVTQIPIELA